MRKLIVLALLSTSIAHAEPELICEPCTPIEKPKRKIGADAIAVLAFGFFTLGAGTAITTSHFFSNPGAGRAFNLLPVVGPLVVVGREDPSFAWTSALVFAAWAQLTGILTLVVTLDHIRRPTSEPPDPEGGYDAKIHF